MLPVMLFPPSFGIMLSRTLPPATSAAAPLVV